MSNDWRTVPLSEICDINPRLGKAVLPEKELFAFVPMAAVGAADGSIDVSAKRPFADVKKGFTPFQSGDVLFAKITPCMENGKMAVVPHLENHYGFGSTEFHVIRPKDGIDPKFVYYHVSAQSFRKEAAHHMTGAVGQKRVPTDFLKQSLIPLPPTIDDQRRIVAEIEKQLSRLDESVTALKRIQANLKRYKAAVLKAAVEGQLTEQWQKDHSDVEPADQLLKRILAERRAKWEAEELAKMKAKGIKPKDDSWKKKYKEPAGPDTANLPELPEGWVWARVEQLTPANRPCAYGVLQPGPDVTDGVILVRVGDINDGRIDLTSLKRIDPKIAANFPRTFLHGGEVLITLVGAIGRTTVVPPQLSGANTARAVGVIPLSELVNSHWVEHWFRNPSTIAEMNHKSHEVARKTLNLEDVRDSVVALPTSIEQSLIVQVVDRYLSVTEELEATIETDLKRAERLRQTILQRAFAGGLF